MLNEMNASLSQRIDDMPNSEFIQLYELIFTAQEKRNEFKDKQALGLKKIKGEIIQKLIEFDYELKDTDILKEF